MTAVTFGNHAALRVRKADRDRVRAFYLGVLGGQLTRELPDKDDVLLGDNFYLAFLYAAGGRAVGEGVAYGADDALEKSEFLKAMFLELKAEDVEGMRRKIIAAGVTVLDVPDTHLYFQAPGGQVFRLVGTQEDLSEYEGKRLS